MTNIVQDEPLLTVLPPVGTTSYTYNTQKNRLLSAGANSFAYDYEGQMNAAYNTFYTFDYEHRLTAISLQPSATSYSYDGSGNRLQAIRSGVTTRYIYGAGGNLLAEADSSNNITKYYIHGLGLLAMVTPSDQTYCYHFNPIGSTIAMTNQSQNMVNQYAYDPFGKVNTQTEAIPQPFKFVGQHGVMTEPNGFYYMRARYYDPSVGRFISEDPIGFEGGDENLYAYVSNQPINNIDPEGTVVPAIIGGVLLAKAGALGVAYIGTKIAQWTANYFAGHTAVSNKVINQTFTKVAVASAISAAVPLTKIVAVSAGGADVRTAATVAFTNPQVVNNVGDFASGFITPGPPSSSAYSYAGQAARYAYDKWSETSGK